MLRAVLVIAALLHGCASVHPPVHSPFIAGAHIESTLVFSCFEKGLMREPKKPATCEPSAIAVHNGHVLLGNDKPIPGPQRSPVFSLSFDGEVIGNQVTAFYEATPFVNARKYEDFTTTPGGEWAFATTGFDRILEHDAKWDSFNTLLYWPVDRPAAVSIAQVSSRQEILSSAALRIEMGRALASDAYPNGPPYWKIEALAAIPGNVLLFGVREIGDSYKKFNYSTQILALPYALDERGFRATGPMEHVYQFDTGVVPEEVAISGLEFHLNTQTLWILTSYEIDDSPHGVGGYLWSLPFTGLPFKNVPTLLRTANHQPLKFKHKSEGVAPLGPHRLVIVHDDDRRSGPKFGRSLHEAVIDIVRVP